MLEYFSRFLRRHWLAGLTGVLVGTSYIPFPPWAAFFCFVPLWTHWLQHRNSFKAVWWSGWLAQFVFTLIGFNWVAYTVHEFGPMPMPVAIVVLFLFCAVAHLHVPLAGLVWVAINRWFRLREWQSLWLLPALLTGAELVYPMIFDWHFGYTWLWAGFPAAHTAEIWGFSFLSGVTWFFNMLSVYVWRAGETKRLFKPLCLGVIIFVSLQIGGAILQKRVPSADSQLNALIVQANIGNLQKQVAEKGEGFQDYIIDKYVGLTQEGLEKHSQQKIDFALWPETAFPERITPETYDSGYTLQLRRFLNKNKLALITGAYSYDDIQMSSTNSLFFFNEKGEQEAPPYSKTYLLAFGEYFPGVSLFPAIKRWFPQVAGFARGRGPETKLFNNVGIGPQICYEGLFDWFSRELAQQEAEVLINVTNDSWFGNWQQPWQHLYMTLARAIEVRRPLIRATNTGISTVMLADGQILKQSPLHKEWNYLYNVPFRQNPPQTVFMTWGYWIGPLFLILWGVLVVAIGKSRRDRLE